VSIRRAVLGGRAAGSVDDPHLTAERPAPASDGATLSGVVFDGDSGVAVEHAESPLSERPELFGREVAAWVVTSFEAALPPAAFRPTSRDKRVENVGRRRSQEQCVAEAQVIIVATALDSAPAAPKRPGDLTENFIRLRVTWVR
jgi:hypothetical protein